MISFHDAFPYFAAAYGLTVDGTIVDAPGPGPERRPGRGRSSASIRAKGIKAIFAEAQFNDDLVRTIADETGATVVSNLYTDTRGRRAAGHLRGDDAPGTSSRSPRRSRREADRQIRRPDPHVPPGRRTIGGPPAETFGSMCCLGRGATPFPETPWFRFRAPLTQPRPTPRRRGGDDHARRRPHLVAIGAVAALVALARHRPGPARRDPRVQEIRPVGRRPGAGRHRLPAARPRGRAGPGPEPPAQHRRVAQDQAGLPVARDAHGVHLRLHRACTSSCWRSIPTPRSAGSARWCRASPATGRRPSRSAPWPCTRCCSRPSPRSGPGCSPPGWWLKAHRFAAVAFLLTWVHSVLAGTDGGALMPLYLVTGLLILAGVAHRWWTARARPQRADRAGRRQPVPRPARAGERPRGGILMSREMLAPARPAGHRARGDRRRHRRGRGRGAGRRPVARRRCPARHRPRGHDHDQRRLRDRDRARRRTSPTRWTASRARSRASRRR